MTQNNDESYFNINQIAKLVGVVPTTLRNWEKKGLFIPKRASNGYRIFTLRDVDILKQVHELSRKSVDPKTIRSLVDKLRQQARNEPILDKSELGSKWRNHRLNRNYSIEQVAAETGISASYIHKIENAQVTNVSFDILHKLALFYGENIFDTQTERLKKKSFSGEKGRLGTD